MPQTGIHLWKKQPFRTLDPGVMSCVFCLGKALSFLAFGNIKVFWMDSGSCRQVLKVILCEHKNLVELQRHLLLWREDNDYLKHSESGMWV